MACISMTRQQIFFFMVLDEEEGEVDALLGVIIVEGLVVKLLCVEGVVIGTGAIEVRPVVLGGLMAVNTGLGLSNTSLIVVDAPLAGLDAGGGGLMELRLGSKTSMSTWQLLLSSSVCGELNWPPPLVAFAAAGGISFSCFCILDH